MGIRTSLNMATERQQSYLHSLIDGRNLFASEKVREMVGTDPAKLREYRASLHEKVPTLTKIEASNWIGKLAAMPIRDDARDPDFTGLMRGIMGVPEPPKEQTWVQYHAAGRDSYVTHPNYPDTPVPSGSYALDTSADDNYANDTTFFRLWVGQRGGWRLYLQHSDDQTELPKPVAAALVSRIAQNPSEAMARYGHAIGRCGVCGRTLTNDESRARGIGPVCAERYGW